MSKKALKKEQEESEDYIYDEFVQDILEHFKRTLKLNKREYDTIIFLSLLILQCEKTIQNVLVRINKKGLSIEKNIFSELSGELAGDIVGELTFSSKIKIYEMIVGKYECYADLKKGVSFFRRLNEIRNSLFHCKLDKIKYNGQRITESKTKHMMICDLNIAVGGGNFKN